MRPATASSLNISAHQPDRRWLGPIGRAMSLGVMAALFSGCGENSGLPLAPVSGTVTVDGQPLTMGIIAFVPDTSQGTTGPMGTSPIGKDGTFRITTTGHDGALAGHHRIKVMAETEYDPATNTPPQSFVHRRYVNEQTSGLTREVIADEENVFNFELDPPEG